MSGSGEVWGWLEGVESCGYGGVGLAFWVRWTSLRGRGFWGVAWWEGGWNRGIEALHFALVDDTSLDHYAVRARAISAPGQRSGASRLLDHHVASCPFELNY